MEVGLVLDPYFGLRLETIAQRMPVWVVDTPTNRPYAEKLWAQRKAGHSAADVTTFCVCESNPADDWCLGILDTIDLHHGEYSADPPYQALEVIGANITDEIRSKLASLGFVNIVANPPRGFRASRRSKA